MTEHPAPDPGTDEARKLGCTCPWSDNNDTVDTLRTIRSDCPVHWKAFQAKRALQIAQYNRDAGNMTMESEE